MRIICLLAFLVTLWSSSATEAPFKTFIPKVKRSELKFSQNTTHIGVDLIQPLTDATAKCLTTQNENLIAIPRSFYQAKADINSHTTMKVAAQNHFLSLSDGLFEGCATCTTDAYSQVSGAFAFLASDRDWSGGMWLSVAASGGWSNDVTKNQKYFMDLVESCVTFSLYGLYCGVFSNSKDWATIFGSKDWTYNIARFSLWYSNNDGIASFEDYVPFGGYSTPVAKQYSLNNAQISKFCFFFGREEYRLESVSVTE